MASPAQVANDMEVRAAFWRGRDAAMAATCRDAARVIRGYLAGDPPEGRAVREVLARICGADALGGVETAHALGRAATTIRDLRKEACHGVR